MSTWRASREWEGKTAFIIAGGPSVKDQNLELLNGQKVIVINSSYETYPAADFLIFCDSRWWAHHCKKVETFKGRIISASSTSQGRRLLRMNRRKPPGLSQDNASVVIQYTSLCSAINLAVHLGVKKIVLLGADGKKAADGTTHHHTPHPWKAVPGCWDKQKIDLKSAAADLKKLKIECVNASPGSAWDDLWPVVKLEDHVPALQS